MTTYKESRSRRKAGRGPIFPMCGKRGDSNGHEFTPASVRRHESGCIKCQEIKELRKSNSQSEYRTNTKKRASLAQFFIGLPFELDEGLYDDELTDFEREIEDSEIGEPE
jgi:hypothetical protein